MQLTVLDRLTMRIRLSEGPMSLHLIPQSNSIDSRCMFEVAADMLFTMIRESAALSTTPPAHALADCWILQPARNVPVATWVQEVDRCVKFCTGLPPPTHWSNRNRGAAKKFACQGCVGRADHQPNDSNARMWLAHGAPAEDLVRSRW